MPASARPFYKCLTCGFLLPKPETLVNPGLLIRATCPACGSEGPMKLDEGIEMEKPVKKRRETLAHRIIAK